MSKQKNNFKNFHRRSTNYVLWSVVLSKLFLEWKRTEGFSSKIDFEIVVKLVQMTEMSIYITRRTDCKFELINALLQFNPVPKIFQSALYFKIQCGSDYKIDS